MMTKRIMPVVPILGALLTLGCASYPDETAPSIVSSLPQIAKVDLRFQSYNIEMVQVTGGKFWAPYGAVEAGTHRYREPVDLRDRRLRALAAQLSPAFLRVSGTWANTTYVAERGEDIAVPPQGFGQILTADQWAGVVAFSKAVDAPLITSFPAGSGTRDAQGAWQSAHADRLLTLTAAAVGRIHAAEFINEPSLVVPGGLPRDYASDQFGRDFRTFAHWATRGAPDMRVLGPGNLGEATVDAGVRRKLMAPGGAMGTERVLKEIAGGIDGVSWHFYGGVSPRCGGGTGLSSPAAALSAAWLDRTLIEYDAIAGLRDMHAAGKPLWLTETGQAACGGSPWAAGFRDSFRYLNQLGLLAQRNVQVVAHNTLAASDYGLIDDRTLEPRPNYWAAVLWRRLMGPVVLQPPGAASSLRVYAHCLPEMNGGVGLMLLNPGDTDAELDVGAKGLAWHMTAADLDRGAVTVNGAMPEMTAAGAVAGLTAAPFGRNIVVTPQSVVFAAVPADNPACSKGRR